MTYSSSRARWYTGATKQIRDTLARSRLPLTVYALSLETGLKVNKIRAALSQMISKSGTVVSVRGPKGIAYTLYQKRPKSNSKGSGVIAGPRTIPAYRT